MPRSSESIGALAAALAKAQIELANPEKSMLATIEADGRGVANQTFRYAPLSSGLDIVRKTLGRHEIATVQTTAVDHAGDFVNLTSLLAHSSGEWISSDWPVCLLDELATPKRMGAALTYARRYALFTLVGIAGEDDLDAPDLNSPESTERAKPVSARRSSLNDGQKRSDRGREAENKSPGLKSRLSAILRDQLLNQLEALNSADATALWARRIIPAKNSLHEADARRVEEAFEAKLTAIDGQTNGVSVGDCHDVPQAKPTSGEVPPAGVAATAQAAEAIDKSELVPPKPRRVRDKDHLRFVSTQPCLICGRTPADPHHLRFAQSRALGRKVSDEWVVALCRGHHREVHRHGDERGWWKKAGIDPNVTARSLWQQSHPTGSI
jgi:hypothetical protein